MNWGNKLLVTFLVFGALIGYLVYRSLSTNFELVEQDYYKNELRYQQVIDGNSRANALTTQVQLQQKDRGVFLQMPEEMKGKKLTGTVWFYCPYDARKDKKFDLVTDSNGSQMFSAPAILPGNYTVKIDWSGEGKNYYAEKKLTVL